MKKLFLIFAISAFFVACNDSATTTETETPATEEVTPADTDSLLVTPADSVVVVDSVATPAQ